MDENEIKEVEAIVLRTFHDMMNGRYLLQHDARNRTLRIVDKREETPLDFPGSGLISVPFEELVGILAAKYISKRLK